MTAEPVPAVTRFRSHRVPATHRSQTERTQAATPGLTGQPSDAERSRTLLAAGRTGALATTSVHSAGYPFASLVTYVVDDEGQPVLCLSDLAEHSRNLATSPRASLMASAAPVASDDPLAGGRVTVLGEVMTLQGAQRAAAESRYRSAHPSAFYSGFGDFRVYRLQVCAVRYVGGFGRMSWVDVDEYRGAEVDPLHGAVERIVGHMNDDHADALVTYCQVLADLPDTTSARMVHVDRYGFDLLATEAGNADPRAVRIPFEQPTDTLGEVRKSMVTLLRHARADGRQGHADR